MLSVNRPPAVASQADESKCNLMQPVHSTGHSRETGGNWMSPAITQASTGLRSVVQAPRWRPGPEARLIRDASRPVAPPVGIEGFAVGSRRARYRENSVV